MKCEKCKFIHPVRGLKCSAFPDRIPLEIYFEKISHDEVLEGQTGDFVYEISKYYEKLESNYRKNLEGVRNWNLKRSEEE
jgi:hypothetical protein